MSCRGCCRFSDALNVAKRTTFGSLLHPAREIITHASNVVARVRVIQYPSIEESSMKILLTLTGLLLTTGSALATIQTKSVEYKVGETVLEGTLAWDDAQTGKRPGVIVIHEWWGNVDYPRKRAEQLAQLGYVAFAADTYGKGKITNDPKQAGEWSKEVAGNPKLLAERFTAAMEILKKDPNVNPDEIAAIGYCYGGSVVLEMARAGMDLDGVVCFHGGLTTEHPENTKSVKARVLICNGADDKWVTVQQIEALKQEMAAARADCRVINYPGAEHAFTNPGADSHKLDNVKYNAAADQKSWEDMNAFLAEVFNAPRRNSGAALPEPLKQPGGSYRVAGDVGRPGTYALSERPISLKQAYISAGGQAPKEGERITIEVTRAARTVRIDAEELLDDRECDFPLGAHDVVDVRVSRTS
jgi:dienelactone hydrolase